MTSEPTVTILVPVYNGAAFVAETLSSIQAQSYNNLRVLISVDDSTDGSAAVCSQYLRDERYEVVEQDRRLGWVDNCNWLLSRVVTPYFCIIPHDDLLNPAYVDRLVAIAQGHPEAAVVYCDIRTFGSAREQCLVQPSIFGTPVARVLCFLVEHFAAIAFRGLVRLEAFQGAGLLQHNPFDDYAEDAVWLFRLAMQGTFRRVAEPLYSKRLHETSMIRRWFACTREVKLKAWEHHCLELAGAVLTAEFPPDHQSLLLHALYCRLLMANPGLNPRIGQLSTQEQRSIASSFRLRLCELIGTERLTALARGAVMGPIDLNRDLLNHK